MDSPASPDDFVKWLLSHVTSDAPRGVDALGASRRLFSLLADPQDRCPSVHLVGTAGKGTVAWMISEGLVGGGHRVVSHLSPHAYDVRERFVLDGELPDWDLVMAAASEVAAASEEAATAGEQPTFFAATAAMSAVVARLVDADFLVIEAGIGGRFDATNVLSRPDVLTVVTAIGLDHTEVLGDTVEAIAIEKVAVLAGRSDVVIAPQPSVEAERAVREVASSLGVRIHDIEAGPDVCWPLMAELTADVALGVLSRTTGRGYAPGATRPPARFERLAAARRDVILDGAHNPMKLDGLVEAVAAENVHPVAVVAAVGLGKDLRGCATRLAQLAPHLIATTFGSAESVGPRGHPTADLASALRQAGVSRVTESLSANAAVSAAVETTTPGDTIIVTGSFLHLAEARDAFITI